MLSIEPHTIRCLVVPVMQGLVWLASMGFSIFFDFGDGFPNVGARNVLMFGVIILLFEILVICIDLKFALAGFRINRNINFLLHCRSVPFLILSFPLASQALLNIDVLSISMFISDLAVLKMSVIHVQASTDEYKIPLYTTPIEI